MGSQMPFIYMQTEEKSTVVSVLPLGTMLVVHQPALVHQVRTLFLKWRVVYLAFAEEN